MYQRIGNEGVGEKPEKEKSEKTHELKPKER